MIDNHRMMLRDAIEALKQANIRSEIYANAKRQDYKFNVGDQVFLKTINYTSGERKFRPKQKLTSKWAGPFEIIEKISATAFRLKLPPQWHIHDVIAQTFGLQLFRTNLKTERHYNHRLILSMGSTSLKKNYKQTKNKTCGIPPTMEGASRRCLLGRRRKFNSL